MFSRNLSLMTAMGVELYSQLDTMLLLHKQKVFLMIFACFLMKKVGNHYRLSFLRKKIALQNFLKWGGELQRFTTFNSFDCWASENDRGEPKLLETG